MIRSARALRSLGSRFVAAILALRMTHFSCWLAIFILLSCLSQAFDTINCGGFVKPSKELSNASAEGKKQMKNVQVEFHTHGTKKESVECLPNGYYIVPIYEKEACILKVKGPAGWHFDPPEVLITANKAVEPCNHNFQLTGFSVSGSILTEASCKATHLSQPTHVTLTSLLESSKIAPKTLAVIDGKYIFENVFPGKYRVDVHSPELTWVKNSVEFQFEWDNVVLEDFVVSGYLISGTVTDSQEGSSVQGVSFFLYSSQKTTFPCEQTNINAITSTGEKKPICGVSSDAKGKFSFPGVPCGQYEIVPFYADESTVFDVIPKRHSVVIDSNLIPMASFSVKGFSVKGRVVGLTGEGLAGVTVLNENDKRPVVTDEHGNYKLDQVVAASYTISASKKHYTFSTISNFKVSPQMTTLPVITATHVDICGRIVISRPPAGITIGNRFVILKDSANKEREIETDPNGAYCARVTPGSYTLIPRIDPREVKAGLVLSDTQIEVVVDSTPVLDVNFDQARLMVSGKVKCLETPCDTSISVSLMATSGRTKERVTTGLEMVHGDDLAADGYFVFKDVFPGKYEVTIHHTNWCWKKETEVLEVVSKDHADLIFIQTGFLFVASASHELDLKVSPSKKPNEEKVLKLVPGENRFCFPDPDKYTLTVESCFQFTSPVFYFDTDVPNPVHFNAQKYTVSGQIIAQSDEKEKATVQVFATSSTNPDKVEAKTTLIETTPTTKTFSFSYLAELKETVTFTPTSPDLFFYPQSRSITLDQGFCPPPLPATRARKGIFLSGIVTPVGLEGLQIHVLNAKDNQPALPVLTTDANGKYVAGPLYDEEEYVVVVKKPGYFIKKISDTEHAATKLGSISVQIDSTAPILLSLSGNEGYTSSAHTNEEGKAQFIDLFPGEYYLRPLLKEFTFDPSVLELEIKDGEDLTASFKSKRVAFSCFGQVRFLDGQPAKGVVVSASSADGANEFSKTDANGNYRIRGLIPGNSYQISVKSSGTQIIRSQPTSITRVIPEHDTHNVDFISFLKSEKVEILGNINTTKELLSTLSVKVTKGTETVDEFRLSPNFVFSLPNLDADTEYTVSLQTTLSSKDNTFTLPSVKVTTQQTNEILQFEFINTVKSTEAELDNSPFLGPLFVIAIVAGFWYRQSLKQYYLSFVQKEGKDSWNAVHKKKK